MPWVQLGTCTDCTPKTGICCGTNLAASLPEWISVQGSGPNGVAAIDTQLRYNQTANVEKVLATGGKPRSELWITSKIDPKVYCDAADPEATALAMVQETLSQLNTSYVDLVLLHEPCNRDSTQPHPSDQKAWNALMHAVKSGWARAIGVDKYAIPQMAALQGTRPAVLMAPMSMSQHDDATIAYCQQNNIHYNAFGVVHGCKFTDEAVVSAATKYNVSTSQVCGAWTRQRGCSMAVGIGTDPSKMSQYTHEDLDIFSFNLTASEMDALNKLQRTVPVTAD